MEICKDISKGLYAFDLRDSAERDAVRSILADARTAWLGAKAQGKPCAASAQT